MASQSIVFFEPDHHGHRMNYVKHLVDLAREDGREFVLASCSATFTSEELNSRLRLQRDECYDLGSWPVGNYNKWFAHVLTKAQSDYPSSTFVVLEGDKVLVSLLRAWRGRGRDLIVLVMRVPIFSMRPRELAKWGLKWTLRLANEARGSRVLGLAPARAESSSYRYRGWTAAPDPVDIPDFKEDAVKRLAADKLVLGIFGHVTARKQIPELLLALSNNSRREQIIVRIMGKIAGEVEDAVLAAVDRARKNGLEVEVQNRLLGDEELLSEMQACDGSIIAYASQGPSGIVALSVAVGTAIVNINNNELKRAIIAMGGTVVDVPSGLSELQSPAWIEGVRTASATPRRLANGKAFASRLIQGST